MSITEDKKLIRSISEELYRVFKSKVLWKDVDFKRLDTFDKILKKRFALAIDEQIQKIAEQHVIEKTNELPVAIETEAKPTDVEELVQLEHATLLQRIVEAQDNALTEAIITTNKEKEVYEKEVKTDQLVKQYKNNIDELKDKRFYIKIQCTGIIKKPNFQVFALPAFVEKHPVTDAIIKQESVYEAYIDTNLKELIFDTIPQYFQNGILSEVKQVDNDFVPMNYKHIWQNRTVL